jgi:hypothetical protein
MSTKNKHQTNEISITSLSRRVNKQERKIHDLEDVVDYLLTRVSKMLVNRK